MTALVAALALTSGCGLDPIETPHAGTDPAAPGSPAASPAPSPAAPGATGSGATTAAALLASLPVKGRAPMTGYDRAHFGPAWLDADRNGCDTRNDVLREQLTDRAVRAGSRDCVVTAGTLEDPYTATSIDFVYGDGTLVDIDHVVALGNAWATGAHRWDIRNRAALANDPMNLLAVDASANRQKGDGDAATWLPPSKRFRCSYVARQVGVKAKYGLWVTPAERQAIERVLASCPGQAPVPGSGAPVRVDHELGDPGAPVTGTPPAGTPGGASAFESCTAARAAGATPVRRGHPGYGAHLDGDGDGVACE
ncbi:GmrSD restriction endonuclease domain-containing protein [Nocardioides dongkuii]|uniref:GmrSD restriction endonuclease domain-containing protein n=1 Tax=Nocardioides dongkuii TaxID=2760089 RepID=UPI001FD295E4|nr:DUF1524 domain-containing protein [Nocardioides dongkuii]